MTITKDGKNYSIPSSYKTTEDDFITISIGYKAKEKFNKSEIATLIVILTNVLYGQNKYEQIRADAINECIDELREEHECWINCGKNDYAFGVRLCIEDLERLKEQK